MSKVLLITGTSTGIGAQTAIKLAQGNDIVVHYRTSLNEAEKVANSVTECGGKPHLIQADLSADEGCMSIANFINDKFGKLDVLVNNAGGLEKTHSAKDITWDLIEKIFSLNTFSAMRLSALCIPFLLKGTSPCIVNITSIAIRTGAPLAPIYGAAKNAIDAFTRGLAKELAPHVRVNAIAPGYIQTPFHEGVVSNDQLKSVADMTPLKRLGEPEDIAMAIELLINNKFMTGETIDVNGGLFMR